MLVQVIVALESSSFEIEIDLTSPSNFSPNNFCTNLSKFTRRKSFTIASSMEVEVLLAASTNSSTEAFGEMLFPTENSAAITGAAADVPPKEVTQASSTF